MRRNITYGSGGVDDAEDADVIARDDQEGRAGAGGAAVQVDSDAGHSRGAAAG